MRPGGIEAMWLRVLESRVPKSLLDVGCRDLRSSFEIARWMGPGYCGVDIDRAAVHVAHSRLWGIGGSVSVIARDDFGLSLNKTFDVVLASCVLYHLSDKLVRPFFKALPKLLTPTGCCLATINCDLPEGRWKGFPFVQRSIQFYEGLALGAGLILKDRGPISDHGYSLRETTATNRLIEVSR